MSRLFDRETREFTAKIDRGEIVLADPNGYVIESYGRYNLRTPKIRAIGNEEYQAGDRVYFFLFDDGDGKILGKMG